MAKLSALRKKLGLHNKKVVAYIGSLSLVSHPVDLLFTAFKDVQNTDPETRMLIVGGGESIGVLHQLSKTLGIDKNTVFVGRIPPNDVVNYYYLADVVVDPIHDDDTARSRSPLKLFESWTCETPFITGDVGDRQNVLGNPPAGILVKPGDPSALSSAIIDLFNNPKWKQEIIQRSQTLAIHYLWENHAKKVMEIYEYLLDNETKN
jgi:glycosyltransferase involved in cell wall biosynthesis